MLRWLGKFSDKLYVLMRIIFGLLFLCHGAQKLVGLVNGSLQPAPLILAAMAIELAAGFLIAIGLWTRVAAFIASGQMAAAYFMMHASRALLPINNGGELAILYCFAFLYFVSKGSGPFAVRRS